MTSASPAAMNGIQAIDVRANGVRLHCLSAGSGPLVVLLHGFPDFSWVWRRQFLPLARAGYRVIAPDLRGFGRSEKTRAFASYDLDVVAGDVADLPRALGEHEVAAVVGHDIGGVVTWRLASLDPSIARCYAVLNAPHPRAWARALRSSDQLLRSAYVAFFQLPLLPELVLRAGGHRILLRTLRRGIHAPGALSGDDVARQRAALAEPGALRGGLNYYRALGRRMLRGRAPHGPAAKAPVLVLWGERDPFLSPALAGAGQEHAPGKVVRFPHAGHWVQLDEADAVNAALLDWFEAAQRGSVRALTPAAHRAGSTSEPSRA